MDLIELEKPKMLAPTELDRYLYRLVEQLQYVISVIPDKTEAQTQTAIATAAGEIQDYAAEPERGYIVFKNGIKCCWMKVPVREEMIDTPYGSLYTAGIALGEFPIVFSHPPIVNTEWYSDAFLAIKANIAYGNEANAGLQYLMTAAPYAVSGTIFVWAIGV